MTHPVYTRQQLEAKKLVDLKAIAKVKGVTAQDKRSKESWIEAILEAQPQPVEEVDDYLFHDDQPSNLPQVGDIHLIGLYLLRCTQVGGDAATAWDVYEDKHSIGEIWMGWDCLWQHSQGLKEFSSPQEAIADLAESTQELAAAKESPSLQVFPTERENIYAVFSYKPGQPITRYEVNLKTNSCTCPHYQHRHGQTGFQDKHIEAVKLALRKIKEKV
jgi:hypothetical protein